MTEVQKSRGLNRAGRPLAFINVVMDQDLVIDIELRPVDCSAAAVRFDINMLRGKHFP